MIKAKYRLTGSVTAGGSVGGGMVDDVLVDGVSVVENKIANIGLRKNVIDILVEYGLIQLGDLTEEQIEAINEMSITIDDGNLILEYDETILDFNFSIVERDLMVENNVDGVDFNINNNKELEVLY